MFQTRTLLVILSQEGGGVEILFCDCLKCETYLRFQTKFSRLTTDFLYLEG